MLHRALTYVLLHPMMAPWWGQQFFALTDFSASAHRLQHATRRDRPALLPLAKMVADRSWRARWRVR